MTFRWNLPLTTPLALAWAYPETIVDSVQTCVQSTNTDPQTVVNKSATKYVVFTDGPNPQTTPAVLDWCECNNVLAIFGVLGEQASQHPRLIRKIFEQGHLLANHTWSHVNAWKAHPVRMIRQLVQTHDLIEAITGESLKLTIPPMDRLSSSLLDYAQHAGWRLLLADESKSIRNQQSTFLYSERYQSAGQILDSLNSKNQPELTIRIAQQQAESAVSETIAA